MKATRNFLIGAVAVSALTLPLHAADKVRDYESDRTMHLERLGKLVKASEVIGKEVKNLRDEKLGQIEDLAVDLETGRILEVFVSSGGVLGVGDKTVAVPPSAFSCEAPHPTLRLDATKEKLQGAPVLDLSKWDATTQIKQVPERYRYFGKEPYFARTHRLEDKSSAAPARMERASKVIGATVRTEGDEKLGKVDNLIVDLEASRIVHVILSSGGFLGVGDDLRALPPTAFRTHGADNALVLTASKEMVIGGPQFKPSQWPNFDDPSYSAGVYRAYRAEPYFSVEADNTRRNVRDRNDRTLTPLDQGSSEADLDLTRRIRKEILEQQNLSVNARNVKVITLNGRVTLRGPVGTAAERRTIEEIVQRLAPGTTLDNQLEVKQPAEQ